MLSLYVHVWTFAMKEEEEAANHQSHPKLFAKVVPGFRPVASDNELHSFLVNTLFSA